jgi:hypothetical protein
MLQHGASTAAKHLRYFFTARRITPSSLAKSTPDSTRFDDFAFFVGYVVTPIIPP